MNRKENAFKLYGLTIIIVFGVLLFINKNIFGESLNQSTNFVFYLGTDYSFRYPKFWQIRSDENYLVISNYDPTILTPHSSSQSNQYFKIEIVKLSRLNNLNLSQWVEMFTRTSHPLPRILERKNIEVGGRSAIYLLEAYGSFVSPAIYVDNEDDVYILNISTTYQNYEEVIDLFVKSFKFQS